MRLPIQLQAVIYRFVDNSIEFLVLHRVPSLGSFWQSVTGGLEEGESFEEGLLREVEEETKLKVLSFHNLNYTFEFVGARGGSLVEHVYCVEVDSSVDLVMSDEHDDYKWLSYDEALDIVKYPGNKKGIELTNQLLN